MSIEEFNTDGLIIDNGAFLASFRLKVLYSDQTMIWHYYGTPVPGDTLNGIPTMQHDAIALQLADFSSAAYDAARQVAVDALAA